jgi:hypothetical protein
MKKFQSKSAEKISIMVWLQKVKHMYLNLRNRLTMEDGSDAPVFNQGLLKIVNQGLLKKFQARSGSKK